MRKIISTVIATAMILFGLWWTWEVLAVPEIGTVSRKFVRFDLLIGVFPALVGCLWLAADWYDL
jgi:hypothetical protein